MKNGYLRNFTIGIAMLISAGLAVALTPRDKVADLGPRINLDAMIPTQFDDWRIDENIAPVQPSPDVQARLSKIYNQTLSRTYVNRNGDRLMLSLAYGGDQSDSMQVHKPEVCYPSQGFHLLEGVHDDIVQLPGYGQIKVRRLVAALGSRMEPITYWIRVGRRVTAGVVDRKLEQINFAFTGKVPDGLLFRVSTLDHDEQAAYRLQDDFIRSLIKSVDQAAKDKLVGTGP